MAKMRTSRISLSKAALEAVYRGAQPFDLSRDILQLGAAHQLAALSGRVIGERFADTLRGVALPAAEGAGGADKALGCDVADEFGELLFCFPAQVLGEVAQLVGQLTR